MKTMERRPDGAFEAWMRGVSVPMLRWMESLSIEQSRRHASEAPRAAYADEGAAEETVARWLVREHLREVWEARRRAPAEEADLLDAARDGVLEGPPRTREPARRLAHAVVAGDVEALPRLVREVCETVPVESPGAVPAGPGLFGPIRLVFLAGRVLRDGGALEEAHAAFRWSRCSWHWWTAPAAPDDRITPARWAWRWAIPYWAGRQVADHVPVAAHFDWSPYDHVVGIGTTIRHRTLDVLGVPFDKQQIVETHFWAPHPFSGPFPRLSGRVAVVDDVNQGETSQTLARLYDADVVDVGRTGCTSITARIHPVCSIENDAVYREVYRPR